MCQGAVTTALPRGQNESLPGWWNRVAHKAVATTSTTVFGYVTLAHDCQRTRRFGPEGSDACQRHQKAGRPAHVKIGLEIRSDCKIRRRNGAKRRRRRAGDSQAGKATPGFHRELRERQTRGSG